MVDGWEVKSGEDKIYYLIKNFKFKNFIESQQFVNKVSSIAEKKVTIQIYRLDGDTLK